jgi:predicted transcriptional regulator
VNKKNLFSTAEEKVLHRLSMFLQLNTNAIVTVGGEYMNVEKMADQTGIDRSNIRKVIKSLMKKNSLGMWKSGDREIYYMNPFLYQMGEIPPYLFNLFDDEYHKRCMVEHSIAKFKAGKKVTSIITAKQTSKAM